MPINPIELSIVVGVCTVSSVVLYWQRSRKLPLPPGPPRWPIIGSLFSMPKDSETREVFTKWGEVYGDITYARVLAQDIIILNSSEVAVELLEHRSTIYSHRPRLVMANELVGWQHAVSGMNYGETFKRTRKLLYEGINPKAMEYLKPVQEQEALKFIQRLLDPRINLNQQIRRTAAATILKITFGYSISGDDDYFLNLGEETVSMFSTATTPGMFLVDSFPWLKYIPWAPFKTQAKAWRQLLDKFRDQPVEYTREQMTKGQSEPCLVARWLERAEEKKDQAEIQRDEWLIKWAGVALYGGGGDTTVSAISSFFLAMIYYPEVQAAAQSEINQVVGRDRLPTHSDRKSLPYIEALYKEVIRWHPVGPLGVPHCLDWERDDEYRGMFIPRGCMIVPNIGAMLSDPKVYPNPEIFKPERFLASDSSPAEPDPEGIAFGFGKRHCPGMLVAQSSVWLSIVLTLATYDITAVVGPDGKPEMPKISYSQTIISHPDPFECTIKPRSPVAKDLIQSAIATSQ